MAMVIRYPEHELAGVVDNLWEARNLLHMTEIQRDGQPRQEALRRVEACIKAALEVLSGEGREEGE